MPATVEIIDDNTFFILYALSKQNKIDIPCLFHLYPNKTIKEILNIFSVLIKKLNVKIYFYQNNNSNESSQVLEIIKNNKEKLNALAEVLNTEIKHNVDFGLDIFEAVENKIAPIILGCRLEHQDPKAIDEWLKNHFKLTQNLRKKLYHHEEMHEKVFNKVLKMAKNNMSSPYHITLKDFQFFSRQSNLPEQRYAFFYYLYGQEKAGRLSLKSFSIENETPNIYINITNEKVKLKTDDKPDGKILAEYLTFDIYENKFIVCSANKNYKKLAPQQFEFLKYCFNKKEKIVSYDELATELKVSPDTIPHIKWKCENIIRDLLENKKACIFKNYQSKKTYELVGHY